MSNKINFGFAQSSEMWLSATFLTTLVILIVPLPTFLMDMCLATNLAAAILLLLLTLNAKRPLDLSVFPSLLLLMTLFRLALNVATTRLILLNGNAGRIVDTFGDLVVGGNLIVGCVVFLILVTIQFIVITKGATRISEVNARFTLDSMPGKQMAIDAELNIGAIDEEEARRRRADLASESEFFGAMDGASKYVRGDAIAGLVIMAVNVIGGVALGISNGQGLADAVQLYTMLTIGDGLVSQIPALVIASSAGILVTKSSSDANLGQEIGNQLHVGRRALTIGAGVLLLLMLVPGLPKIPFLLLAAGILWLNRSRAKSEADAAEAPPAQEPPPADATDSTSVDLEQFLRMDRIVVEVGAGLIPLVDPQSENNVAKRVASLRKDLGKQFGIWIPKVRIQDDLSMDVQSYRIRVNERIVGEGELRPREFLAINPGQLQTDIEGQATTDPAFGLDAIWIGEGSKRRAEIAGFTVVDSGTVLTTHLGECLKRHAAELLSRDDLQAMLTQLEAKAPALVGEIRADGLNANTIHQILLNLLREAVPISSLERIIESALLSHAQSSSVAELTEKVRAAIGATIVERFRNADGKVNVILLEPKLEHQLRQSSDANLVSLLPGQLANLVDAIKTPWELASLEDQPTAVLIDSGLRLALRQTVHRSIPQIPILSYSEIPGELMIEPRAVIRFDQVFESEPIEPIQAT